MEQERKPVEGAPGRTGKKYFVIIFAVASVLVLAVCGYFLATMAGWWTGPGWMNVAAAVVLAGVIAAGRLFSK